MVDHRYDLDSEKSPLLEMWIASVQYTACKSTAGLCILLEQKIMEFENYSNLWSVKFF